MNRRNLLALISIIVFFSFISGCGAPKSTPQPTIAVSPIPPSPTEKISIKEMEQNISAEFEIFYDGTGCTVSGPLEVSTGFYVVTLNDQTDEKNEIYVSHLLAGHSHQDAIDLQPGPGIYYPKPDWTIYADKYFSFGLNNWIYHLKEPGEYTIYIGAIYPKNTLWFCSPLKVVE